ncbi:hypothetical protein ACFROC_00475 [Nocardia tengchongensis]|uniref:hypothetical protein n=1 Tax=Nocardia tengchongensis TaxID=2055889 RepID=UPI0036C6E833
MALEVDPQALADTAIAVSELARALHAALPAGWMSPAGADAGSAAATGYFNGLAETVYNDLTRVVNAVSAHSHQVGAAAADYSTADADAARLLGANGGAALSNPVSIASTHAPRTAPAAPTVSQAAVDPLTYAEQLHSGPGPGTARAFAAAIRDFVGGAHSAALTDLDGAAASLAAWTPVGTAAAAELASHRVALTDIGSGLSALASGVDAYADAFQWAKDRHPTPWEIQSTRRRLLAAMRSKNSAELSAALAEFDEQNAVSAQTAADYATKLGTAATTASPANTSTGTNTAGTNTTGSGSGGGGESSMLTSLLPTLLSSLTGSNGLLSHSNTNNSELDDLGYDDLTGGDDLLPTIPSFTGGGPSVPGVSPNSPLDVETTGNPFVQLPTVGALSTLGNAGLPRTPVIDQLPVQSGTPIAARGGSSPYMPYMPMSPGMGGGGARGGDRNRVVAWHPDRLMFVDDTPHTEAVIGEKPSIAPAITPATPAQQTPTPTGGTA